MAKDEAKVLGDKRTFKLSPKIKAYALRDVGFMKTPRGVFQLERPLQGNSPYNAAYMLKMSVSADLTALKMSVTDRSGMKSVNIFKDEKNVDEVEQFNFQIDNLIERDILIVTA
ncbi:DUF1831 domain-containing protein [Lapidilactobacillus wuchangensis]|uniref:DUF1831 domain-containing protein n=1 Tax=Lapidilactobacillus wuchangensis TaxID=2486001 RepID=UPI000F7B1BAE|nr:DUF1831 domain-containing protein [Lapidilactobacillus wuchangensis]